MLFAFLAATATCAAPDASALLSAYRQAAVSELVPAVRKERYIYSGQGITGEASSTIDEVTGAFAYSLDAGIVRTASGFDGRTPWRSDLTGFSTEQTGGNKVALAISEAYRNANLWWRDDHGGAGIEAVSCHKLRVTPRGGVTFEASFDPATHLLSEVTEVQSFATLRQTLYSDWHRMSGRFLPRRITIITNGDVDAPQIQTLKSVEIKREADRSFFAKPALPRRDWSLPAVGKVTVSFELLNNHIIIPVQVNGGAARPSYSILAASTFLHLLRSAEPG